MGRPEVSRARQGPVEDARKTESVGRPESIAAQDESISPRASSRPCGPPDVPVPGPGPCGRRLALLPFDHSDPG